MNNVQVNALFNNNVSEFIVFFYFQNWTRRHQVKSQICSNVLAADVRSIRWWCVHSCTHRCCSFAIVISWPRWPRRSTRTVHSVWLPQFPRARTSNLDFYRICEARTLGNS